MRQRNSLAFLLLVLAGSAFGAPTHSPWPGGVGLVRIEAASRPVVTVAGQRALVLASEDGWTAVIGIPLDQDAASPLEIDIVTPGAAARTQAIDLGEADYRVQRLNVDRKYVDLDEEVLARVLAEREVIDAALTRWRDEAAPDLELDVPVPGRRSSSFGSRRIFNDQPRSPHKGMDIAAVTGTPILAPATGVVSVTGDFYFNGNTVILDHGQGFISLYCHLSEIAVAKGETISAGKELGKVGATGRVTGAHLHFATYLNGTAIDPALLLAE
jgi:murein DD-endopeptidase MepM/ murein hydrolase activator NlpD